MQLRIERRAEIAIRSLPKKEQKVIERALKDLMASDRVDFTQKWKVHKLKLGYSDRNLFIYRGTPKLRLVLAFEDEVCVLLDVVAPDRLGYLGKQEGQE